MLAVASAPPAAGAGRSPTVLFRAMPKVYGNFESHSKTESMAWGHGASAPHAARGIRIHQPSDRFPPNVDFRYAAFPLADRSQRDHVPIGLEVDVTIRSRDLHPVRVVHTETVVPVRRHVRCSLVAMACDFVTVTEVH